MNPQGKRNRPDSSSSASSDPEAQIHDRYSAPHPAQQCKRKE